MEFYEVVNNRRTIREFSGKEISTDVLKRILDAGLKAPSSDHMRQWEPIAITDKEVIKAVTKDIKAVPCNIADPKTPQQEMFKIALPKQQSMLATGSCLILPYFKQQGSLYKPENVFTLINYGATWAMIENILLAATTEGLCCAIHVPTETEPSSIQEVVVVPNEYVLPVVISIGYPAENAEVPTQVSATVEDKVHWNKW